MCTYLSRNFDKTKVILDGFLLSLDFGRGTVLTIVSSDGFFFKLMHKIKIYVSELIMYCNEFY